MPQGRGFNIRKVGMSLNRISGIVVAVFGMALLFWIIPRNTEPAVFGWLHPATLPNITAVVIIVSSIVHILFPAGTAEFDGRLAARAGVFFLVSLVGLYCIHRVGYLITAPILVMILMLMVGERRWLWLFTGAVVIPLAIWYCIEVLLKRPLF